MLTAPYPPHAEIIGRANLSDATKTKYTRAISRMIESRVDPRNARQLAAYAAGLSIPSRLQLKAALKVLFADTATWLKAGATPENLAQVQARLLNLEAMDKAIHTHKPESEKAHTWLTQAQVDSLLALPDPSTIRGARDYIVLAVLVGAGLRREELSALTFDALKQLPGREVLEVTGKGKKTRVVPISPTLARRLHAWQETTGGGNVARSLEQSGALGESLSTVGIWKIVNEYGARLGFPELAPHDLRRTFGRLGWEATHDLILIKSLLGHSSARTTENYIGIKIQLDSTVSDSIIHEYQSTIGD